MDRSSGILLPVSALPGPCGIGDLGKDARDFIDFLAAAGQRYWQILPLNPPDGAYSPYLSASTFAGSTDLLSPEPFVARGALTLDEVRAIDWGVTPCAWTTRACTRAGPRSGIGVLRSERDCCCARTARRARGRAVAARLLPVHGSEGRAGRRAVVCLAAAPARPGRCCARSRGRAARRPRAPARLPPDGVHPPVDAVRAYAHAHGVRIIGDLPMYVAPDSADVWAQPAQFCLDPDGQPSAARRCPAGLFQRRRTALGQPALRLGCHARGRLPVVEGAHPRCSKALRCGAYRPFSRHFELLGGAAPAN